MAVSAAPCPNCKRLTTWEGNPHRPFCSERCRLVDFGEWASEGYRIPGRPVDASDEVPNSEDDDTE